MNYEILDFDIHGDSRGKLVALEGGREIPFDVKRIYYIYDTLVDQDRGQHAHRDLEQIIIAINGSCDFLLDDGRGSQETVHLSQPDQGLFIGKNIWREMKHFSDDCKLVILASKHYDEKEYIRNYEDFIKEIQDDSSPV